MKSSTNSSSNIEKGQEPKKEVQGLQFGKDYQVMEQVMKMLHQICQLQIKLQSQQGKQGANQQPYGATQPTTIESLSTDEHDD